MFPFFKKKEAQPRFEPAMTGRLETTYEQLKKDFGTKLAGRIYDIDIGEFTKEFSGSLKVPAKIQEAVRRVFDDYLKEGSEFYFQVDEKVFGIFLGKATKAVAELKVQVIRNELGRAIEKLKNQKKAPASVIRNCGRVTPVVVDHAANDFSRSSGTLSGNFHEKEMRDWASRALLNMATAYGYEDFQADVQRLADMITIQFKPLWYFPNKLISGYVMETSASFTEVEYDEKQSQEDLALLAAAVRHLKAMAGRGEFALLIVPVFFHTICGKATRDLFNIYCRSLDPELKRFLVLRIKGMDFETVGATDWDYLKTAASHCRSIVIDVPSQDRFDPGKSLPLNFHAFGFDLSHLSLSEDRLFNLINRFADFYQRKDKDTFLFGIQSRSLLSAALDAGYAYVSGPAVSPFLERPKHASYLELADIYLRN